MACAAVLLVPSAQALAAGGFTDYRQAAADQYGSSSQNPPAPDSAPTSGSATGRPTGAIKAVHQSGGTKHPSGGADHGAGQNGAGGGASPTVLGAGDRNPVLVTANPSPPRESPSGTLPFTGGALGILVLIALALLATGLLVAAVLRVSRRRQTLA